MSEKRLRTLPVRPLPAAGESLPSYVARAAARNHVNPRDLLLRTNILPEPSRTVYTYTRGYGIVLSERLLEQAAYVLRLSEQTVSSMLVSRYDGVAINLGKYNSLEPVIYANRVPGPWVYFKGSHVCPKCLEEEGGVWQIKWKLPWSYACLKHKCLLVDCCPSCGARPSLERGLGLAVAAGVRPGLAACRATAPSATHRRREYSVMCGYSLEDSAAQAVDAQSHILRVQEHLDRALEGEPGGVLGEVTPSLDYFGYLRSLCVMLLDLGVMDDLVSVPQEVKNKFAMHVAAREEARHARNRRRTNAQSPPKSTALLPFRVMPESATLMAAVAPTAMYLLDSDSLITLTDRLRPFVARAQEFVGRRVPAHFRIFSFAGPLEEAFIKSWQPMRLVAHLFLGSYADRPTSKDNHLLSLSPDLVPQLWNQGAYDEMLADLMPGRRKMNHRRVCSMAILRITDQYTWKEAAASLGLPTSDVGYATGIMTGMGKMGTKETFLLRIREQALQITHDPKPTNYGVLRRLLVDLRQVDVNDWRTMCRETKQSPLGREAIHYAAVWLWSYLTKGDFRLSPWFSDNDNDRRRHAYRNFVVNTLDEPLKERLIVYGRALLPTEPFGSET